MPVSHESSFDVQESYAVIRIDKYDDEAHVDEYSVIGENMLVLGDKLVDSPNLIVPGGQDVEDDTSGNVAADLAVIDRLDLDVGGEVTASLVLSRCCVRRGSVDVAIDTGL